MPDSPTLYNMTIKYGNDTVQSYTGFRTVSRGVIGTVQRPLLNGKFIFPFGTLDQGYWCVTVRLHFSCMLAKYFPGQTVSILLLA